MLGGVSLFQFYVLDDFGVGDPWIALGAGLIGLGGLVFMAGRALR
jgi:hypothetical protein